MVFRDFLRNRLYVRLTLITCIALLVLLLFFNRHQFPGNSVSMSNYESLQRECDRRIESMQQEHQELTARVSQVQEELRIIAGERDSLREDKAQLLFMVEKLESQSARLSASGQESAPAKNVRSWLVRIAELRNTELPDNAAARNEYINEINEVVRELKDDFAEDVFITGLGFSKTSASVKRDISAAQKKLDDITRHLHATYGPGID